MRFVERPIGAVVDPTVTAATQNLVFADATGVLVIDVPDGRPSAVDSVEVFRASQNDNTEAEFTPTGTVEATPNTTTSASAGRNETDPRKITLTALTGVTVGRRYHIVGADGLQEQLEVASIVTSSSYVLARHPLKNQYASGATFHSRRVAAPVDATWVADLSNISPASNPNPAYRVRWALTVGGIARIYERGLDLGRYEAQHNVTPLDVDDAHPGFLDGLPPDHIADQGRRLIDRAFASVKFELYGDAKADQAIRNPELVARLTIQRVPLEALRDQLAAGGDVNPERVATAEREFRQIYDQTIRAPVAAVDISGGGAAQTVKPQPLLCR